MRGSRLHGSDGASACAGTGGALAPFGPVWPCLLLAARLEMRPRWPRLALRSLVRAGPAWPCSLVVASLRVARSGKLLKPSHFLSSSRRRGCEVPVFTGTTTIGRYDDACDQCRGLARRGAMGSCRWLGVHSSGVNLTLILTSSQGEKGSARLRGHDERGTTGRDASST